MKNCQEQWNKYYTYRRYQVRYPDSSLVSFVYRNFSVSDKILDLGCGAGRHVKFLAENGFEVYATDFSPNAVRVAKQILEDANLTAEITLGTIDNIEYADNYFDGIICYGVFLYNDEEKILKAAKEIYRVLKDGAKAYIVLRNIYDYRYVNNSKISKYIALINEKDSKKSAYSENGMLMYFFDKDEIERVFKDFSSIEINRQTVSHENNTVVDDDYIVILKK